MPKINVLPRHMAELIAAGEVVERPASVIKELMENSVDAGATSITVEIKRGGITYIRITDNGCGIGRADVSNAFLSHATSKVATPDDLSSIGTLGFRGEALASICAVSKVEMMTKTIDEQIGTRCVVAGSQQMELDDAGCPQGTTIVVRDIFYNTPARMKFLKKDVTEGNAVAGVVDRIALSHPEISVRFIRDGKETLLTPGNGKLDSAIYAVFGKDFSSGLIPTSYELNGIEVSGFISKPLASRANRSMQFFFLNGRLVKSQTAMAALEQAYKNSIMHGKFPSCVLNILAPYESIDVNVHPAKIQVRFENEKKIFDAVYYAVKSAIDKNDKPAQIDLSKLGNNVLLKKEKEVEQITFSKSNDNFWQDVKSTDYVDTKNQSKEPEMSPAQNVYKTILEQPKQIGYENKNEKDTPPLTDLKANEILENPNTQQSIGNIIDAKTSTNSEVLEKTKEIKTQYIPVKDTQDNKKQIDFKVIGEAFKAYIIVEFENKILIIDKHAAHERMIFEKIKGRQKLSNTQLLIAPVTVTVSKEEYCALMDNRELLSDAGFEIDDFGAGTVVVRECPVELSQPDVSQVIQELAGYLLSSRQPEPEQLDWIYHSTACRAAIKAGDKTSDYELTEFVKMLLLDDTIRYCPHGRPVFIEMTKSQLEKQFGRI